MKRPLVLAFLLSALLMAGCAEIERLQERVAGAPHERYVAALRDAGLDRAAVGAAWLAAADNALASPISAEAPFREVAYFDPAEPLAAAFAFDAARGERVHIALRRAPGDSARVFLDLFALREGGSVRRLAGTETVSDSAGFVHEAGRAERLLVRVQPEALGGGRVTLTVAVGASLAFPVSGVDARAIRSVFGDPRDGGRRRHEGVDVFAPRGTPALAAAAGTVTRVAEGGLGGKVVWLRPDGRALSLYYAHLDQQLVSTGQRVAPGDTLGLVGTTGNARHTPPHLHFGVYAAGLGERGAVDPMPFIDDRRAAPPPVRVAEGVLGGWVRTRGGGVRLEGGEPLPARTPLRVLGAQGDRYRVATPEGGGGYVAARLVEPPPPAFSPLVGGGTLRARPSEAAAAVDSLAAGTPIREVGRGGDFVLVETEGGRRGWVVPGS